MVRRVLLVVFFVGAPVRIGMGGPSRTPAEVEVSIMIPHPLTMLAQSGTVHVELGLGPDQISAVRAAVEAVDLGLWQLRDAPLPKRNPSAGSLLAQLRETLAQTLSLQQMRRLEQLTLRARGVRALLDKQVTADLRLSSRQVQALRQRLGPQQTGEPAEPDPLSILSSRQRRKWASLTGPAFDLSRVRQRACRAPELRDVTAWINAGPVTPAQMRGKVVILHFYAFGCINCVRNLPHYNRWYEEFPPDRVKIIGIHRPETQAERAVQEVRRKAAETGMKYPIAVDNESRNWEAWANRIWPSVYLIDKQGFVRYWWYGELDWQGAGGQHWIRGKVHELLGEDRP